MSTENMIRHTVVFKLKHEPNSAAEHQFLEQARKLTSLPTVLNFECLQQISSKNHFTHGLSMEFVNDEAYQAYNENPLHIAFVKNYWLSEVEDFLEIDYLISDKKGEI